MVYAHGYRTSTVIAALLATAATGTLAADYQVGDVVVATEMTELRAGDQVTDRVQRGFTFPALAVRGKRLWVSRGFPGWLHAKHTIPLDDAVPQFTRAIRCDPSDALNYWARGTVHQELRNPDAARADFEQAARLDPAMAPAYNSLGSLWNDDGFYNRAIDCYNQAVQLYDNQRRSGPFDPAREQAVALSNRGFCRLSSGAHREAADDFDAAIRQEPKLSHAYVGRGWCHAASWQWEEALGAFDEAIRLDPKLASAYHGRGQAKAGANDHRAALSDFGTATELYRRQLQTIGTARDRRSCRERLAFVLVSRALTHADVGQCNQAFADFEQALSVDPGCESAYLSRAQVHRRRGQDQEALDCWQHAIRIYMGRIAERPTPRVRRALAEVLTERGAFHGWRERKAARADYTEAIRTDPQYAQAFHQRSLLSIGEERYAEALADSQQAITLLPGWASAHRVRDWLTRKLAETSVAGATGPNVPK
jgi:tetratricopeptide (TPR) repeat protein